MQDQKQKENKNQESTFQGCVSFDEFKKSLGPMASKYSDEEIEKQRVIADKMADVFFDAWLRNINSGKIANKNKQYD